MNSRRLPNDPPLNHKSSLNMEQEAGKSEKMTDNRRSLGVQDYGKGLHPPFMFLKMNRESLVKKSR